jgi:mono/diheme cytochrome c family protein
MKMFSANSHHWLGIAVVMVAAAAVTIGINLRYANAENAFALNGDAEKGKAVFTQYCRPCHGEKGDGKGPAGMAMNPKPRDFNDKAFMDSMTDEHIYKVVGEGGSSVGKSPLMTPWKGTLTDQQIRDVSAYVRSIGKK